MAQPEGFDYEQRGETVVIRRHGREAATLRGSRAATFLADLDGDDDPQRVMARWTGNYRRGNERSGKDHPRNRKPQ